VDSLMPQEVGAPLTPTPTLADFRSNSTAYTESRSVFSAETIPNHVAMMTGAYPENNGIPTNNYWNRQGEPSERDLSLPTELETRTLFTRIKDECPNIRTAAAMSKDYLYEVFTDCGFSGQDCGINRAPDAHFDPTAHPTFIPQPAGLTPDNATMQAALDQLPNADFLFINLGQVDRQGHADETGVTGTPLLRNAVLAETDIEIRRFIQALQDAGRWEKSVLFIVSDHGMDWSQPLNFINTTPTVEPFGLFAIDNGGTNSYFVTTPADPMRDSKLMMARTALLATEGIEDVWYTQLNPLDPDITTLLPEHLHARHENIGDMVAAAQTGYRFSESSQQSNPIPGSHGHKITLHNTFMIGGGAPFVRAQAISEPDEPVDHFERRAGQSENLDVAPTVAWLFGMGSTGFDGRPLTEAFSVASPPSLCGVLTP
ncbi:MAG: alkaline phosphatase family protein, partial [Nevskiales bacterium]